MAMLGLGGERLIFYTSTNAYPFGIGLSDAAAMAAIEQIEQFCGKPKPPSSNVANSSNSGLINSTSDLL